jgi:hypothetical protein
VCEQYSQHGADCSEEKTLGKQLANDAPPARAERNAYRHLSSSRRRANEHEICDVSAGNQQHEADGAEQDQEWLSHVANKSLMQ